MAKCLPCLALLLSLRTGLLAQCTVSRAVSEVTAASCLSKEQGGKLGDWLIVLPEPERDQALKTVRGALQCLREKEVVPDTSRCARETLQNWFGVEDRPGQACLLGRLSRALATLQQIAASQAGSPAPSQLDMGVVDGALNEFLSGYRASRLVHESPQSETSDKLRSAWCLNAIQSPPIESTRGIIDVLVRIAAVNPGQGRHLGAILGAILRDARKSSEDDARVLAELDNSYEHLIDLDRENLGGTSHFYFFRQDLARVVPVPDWPELSQIDALLKESEIPRELDAGVGLLQDHSKAWKPYEEYSNVLYDLAQRLRSDSVAWDRRDLLIQRACRVLRRGIEVSTGIEKQALDRIQNKLFDQVVAHGLDLARAMRYRDLVAFERQFLDESFATLARDRQCYIHAHLAQAYYALGDDRNAEEQFPLSCGITRKDLKRP